MKTIKKTIQLTNGKIRTEIYLLKEDVLGLIKEIDPRDVSVALKELKARIE